MRSFSSLSSSANSSAVVGSGDLLRLAGALVFSPDVQDTVGVHLEGDLDLGLAAGRGSDPVQVKLAEEMAVLGQGALTLEDLDGHGGLLVLVGREGLRLLGRDDGVARDNLGHR